MKWFYKARLFPTILFGTILLVNIRLDAATTGALTMAAAIQAALTKNPDLQQVQNSVATNAIAVDEQKTGFYPGLYASASTNFSRGHNYDVVTDAVSSSTSNSFSTGLSSSINLFNGFADVAALDAAKQRYSGQIATYQRQRETTAFNTITRFFTAIKDSEYIRIANQNLTAQQDLLNKTEASYKQGQKAITDLLQQKADIAQAELAVLNAQNAYDVARFQLGQIIGQDAAVAPLPFFPEHSVILNEWLTNAPTPDLESALATRTDYQALVHAVDASKAGLITAKSGYLPALNLSLSGGTSYRGGSSLDFSRQFTEVNPSIGAGLSMSIPIWNKNHTKQSVQRAQINVNNAELTLTSARLSINFQLQQAWFDLTTALKTRQSALARMDYAKQSMDIAQDKYRLGAISYVDLSQVRATYLSAAYSLVDADFNVLSKHLAYEYAKGSLLDAITIFK